MTLTARETHEPPTRVVGGGWKAPGLADETNRHYVARVVVTIAILLVISLADLLLIKSTLDRVLRLRQELSWLTSVGLTVAAIAAMMYAGAEAKRRYATGDRNTARLVLLVTGWALVGLGMFVLRWNASAFTFVEETDSGGTRPPDNEWLVALVMLAIFVVTGALAFLDGWKLTNPVAARGRRTRRELAKVLRRLPDLEAHYARLLQHQAIHLEQLAQAQPDREAAERAHQALLDRLKEFARIRIAAHLGDPAATGVIRSRPSREER